jgi:hypothetical protein
MVMEKIARYAYLKHTLGSKLYKKYFITLVLEHGITEMKSRIQIVIKSFIPV